MGSPGNLDGIHDEYDLVEVLEAVFVRFERASIVTIADTIQTDEATTCLALSGMRWLDKSEIAEDSRRRDIVCGSPEITGDFGSAHGGGSAETGMPSRHSSKHMHWTEDRSIPPYLSLSWSGNTPNSEALAFQATRKSTITSGI